MQWKIGTLYIRGSLIAAPVPRMNSAHNLQQNKPLNGSRISRLYNMCIFSSISYLKKKKEKGKRLLWKQGADEWDCNYSAFHLETQSNPLPILSGYRALILLQKQMNVSSMHTKSISDVAYVTGRRHCQHLSLSGLHSYISRGVHVRLHHWTQCRFFCFVFLEGCAVTTYLQWRFKTKVKFHCYLLLCPWGHCWMAGQWTGRQPPGWSRGWGFSSLSAPEAQTEPLTSKSHLCPSEK